MFLQVCAAFSALGVNLIQGSPIKSSIDQIAFKVEIKARKHNAL